MTQHLRSGDEAAPAPRRATARPGTAGTPGDRHEMRHCLRVYLVEDNVIVRESLIARWRNSPPCESSAARRTGASRSTGCDASDAPCDLMIIDLFLHSGSGLGMLAAARRQRPGAAIVVLSNYATEELRARCLAGGADRVFDKSRDIDLLVGYCTALAERRTGDRAH
jgi:DNA-binding NarL/FixJ family response regulator